MNKIILLNVDDSSLLAPGRGGRGERSGDVTPMFDNDVKMKADDFITVTNVVESDTSNIACSHNQGVKEHVERSELPVRSERTLASRTISLASADGR